MHLNNTQTNFGSIAKALHWATAFLVITLFPLGYYIARLSPDSTQEVERAFFLFSLHKTIGMVVLTLAILRIAWWLFQPRPIPLHTERPLETIIAQTVHWLLYVLILLMPITGWLHHSATTGLADIWGPFPQRVALVPQTIQWEEFFGWMHYASAWLMGLVVALHIAGALKHAIIDNDDTLRRMLPGRPVSNAVSGIEHVRSEKSSKWVALAVLGVFAVILQVFAPEHHAEDDVIAVIPTTSEGGWIIDYDKSTLEIEIVQSNTPTKGRFARWTGDIKFAPDKPEDAQVTVSIEIASLTLGSVTQQALSGDYLKAEEHPVAQFQGNGFTELASGEFQVDGDLELAGLVRPLTLTFELVIDGQVANANGLATIHRLEHGVGPESQTVEHEVNVRFKVVASTN